MLENYIKAMDSLQLSPEADERIRRTLAAACCERTQEVKPMKHHRKKLSALMIAAIVAVCLLAGTALAVALSRVDMNVTDWSIFHNDDQKHFSIEFDPTDEDYIELGHWYPQSLPEGFEESFVSEQMSGSQRLVWRNETGDCLALVCHIASETVDISLDGNLNQEEVSIRGSAGTLFTDESPVDTELYKALFWTAPEYGIGFFLEYGGSEDIDLIAIAESVIRIDEADAPIPTYAEEKYKALEELGDYMPTIPEGYELYEFTGMPKDHGGGWYAYVRRYWQNEAHDTIHFSYETFSPAPDAGEIDFNTYEEALAKAEAGESSITWTDPDLGLSFFLSADALSGEDLAALMESIALP